MGVSDSRDVHVRLRDDCWSVEVVDGEDEPRSFHAEPAVAWREARDIVQGLGLEAVLHRRGGYVRDRTRFAR